MDSSSSFFNIPDLFSQAEPLNIGGATCDCYRVRLYGRLHFLKRLKEELRTDPRYVAAMQKEFEAGYNLDHPYIVKYLSRGDDYMLMEYVDGEQLSSFMSNHPDFFTTKAHVDRFLSQLLAAVDCLHQHGIVHLDLKPQNILITRVGQNVKLVDLGFCYTDAYPNTMGRTDRYAAPEQHDPHQLPDQRTDIYAIGRILEQFPCAYKYNKVIVRCTEAQPKMRYQSAQELLSAIHSKTFLWWPLAVFAIVIALMLAFYLFWTRSAAVPVADTQSYDTISPANVTAPINGNKQDEQMNNQPEAQKHTTADVSTDKGGYQQAKDAETDGTSPTYKKEQAASPSSAEKMSVTELRQKLRSVIQPVYVSTLEPLTRKPYVGNEQLYNSASESFRSQLRDRLHPLGEELVKTGAVEQYTFYKEWSSMEMEYINKAYDQMVENQEQPSNDTQKP